MIDKCIISRLKELNIIESTSHTKLKNGYLLGYVDKNIKKGRAKTRNDIYYFHTLRTLAQTAITNSHNPRILTDMKLQNGDLVLVKIKQSTKPFRCKDSTRNDVVLVEILYRNISNVIGILKQCGSERRILHLKTGEILQVKASQKSLKTLPLDCIFEINIAKKEIINVIGLLECAKNDLEIVLKSHNKQINFSDEVLDYVKSFDFDINVRDFDDRVDLTHLPFVTIDPDDARDFDDAIYFDGVNLFVAIADVSYYVAESSIIDNEALRRGFSMYFPNVCVPMLPPILSQNRCSLQESSNRLAFTWKLKINKKTLEVSNAELFLSIVNIEKNLNYNNVSEILHNPNPNNVIHKMLYSLFVITSKIRKKRLKNGLDFTNKEIKLELDSNDEIVSVITKNELESHKLVEECMLLANKQSAILMDKTLNSGIYRVHDEISDENLCNIFGDFGLIMPKKQTNKHDIIAKLQQNLQCNKPNKILDKSKRKNLVQNAIQSFRQEIIDKTIISYMPKAQYSSKNIGHFALGFDSYTHFTSPIRRYSDIIAHRILKEILQSNIKKARFLLSEVDLIASRMNFLEKDIAKIGFEYEDRKYARYFANRIGERVKCIVVDEKKPYIAKIIDSNARIFLDKSSVAIRKLSLIEAQITHSDIETTRISAKVIKEILKDYDV